MLIIFYSNEISILRCQMYEDAKGYGVEVDNWALGVIFFTLLAGYAPFYHRFITFILKYIFLSQTATSNDASHSRRQI